MSQEVRVPDIGDFKDVAVIEVMVKPGEVIEFDTRLPHWFGSADGKPVEYLGIYGPQGERAHHVSRAGGPE